MRSGEKRPNQMNMTPYEGHPFECACGASHRYAFTSVPVLRELTKMRLVLCCPETKALTCVRVKGIVRFRGFESLFGARPPEPRADNAFAPGAQDQRVGT